MKIKLLLFALLLQFTLSAQDTLLKYDTLISNAAYKSYYSKNFKCPVAVTYTLNKGGGDCSRTSMRFYNDIKGLSSAKDFDYTGSGYDKGHMVDAEDYAFDCKLEELTFRYYNCVPQTPELNRGQWKHYETVIRKISQDDTLSIICYNEFSLNRINNVYIPTKCYKFVKSKKYNKIIFAFYFTNNNQPEFKDLSNEIDSYNFILKLLQP